MKTSFLLHHLIFQSLQDHPKNIALKDQESKLTYTDLALKVVSLGSYFLSEKIASHQRIAIFLEKRFEFVISCFAASCSGNMFIPINPILKQDQVFHILQDSDSKVLITSIQRIEPLLSSLNKLLNLSKIILTDSTAEDITRLTLAHKDIFEKISLSSWHETEHNSLTTHLELLNPEFSLVPQIDIDAVSIFYTSGSTGKPKGVVLSHRNMIFGAKNVASYLNNAHDDIILAALPLSFDAGFSQITTAFHVGATVILLNYILPNDILSTVIKEKVTGLTAVPPLWIQISNLNWPESVTDHLKYFANTGGKMPAEILKRLRSAFPKTKPYLMYGLTESFRSTYLPPEEIDRRPHSIGKAIPNAEILVLKSDGSHCKPREPGELVHRGALVGLGYWNDPEKTAERYKIMPSNASSRPSQIMIPEIVVYSGDIVEMDEDGFLYFIGRNDEMIKTTGYRVSPMEVEEIIYNSGLVEEAAAFSIPHPKLEQAIIVIAKTFSAPSDEIHYKIFQYCKEKMPSYMIPNELKLTSAPLPRNQNGKIDRKKLAMDFKKSKDSI